MTDPRVAKSTRCLFAAVLASSCTPLVEATPADDGSSGGAVTTNAGTTSQTTVAPTGDGADSTTVVPPGTTTGGSGGSTSSSGTSVDPIDSSTSDSGTSGPGTTGSGTTGPGTTGAGTTGSGTGPATGGSSSGGASSGTAGDACAAGSEQTLTITANGVSDYVINGANDPDLTVVRGCTYTFDLNAPGHPFYIKTVSSTGVGNAYNDGVSGNGATVGSFTWDVQSNAPDDLFYNCSNHAGMAGNISVID